MEQNKECKHCGRERKPRPGGDYQRCAYCRAEKRKEKELERRKKLAA